MFTLRHLGSMAVLFGMLSVFGCKPDENSETPDAATGSAAPPNDAGAASVPAELDAGATDASSLTDAEAPADELTVVLGWPSDAASSSNPSVDAAGERDADTTAASSGVDAAASSDVPSNVQSGVDAAVDVASDTNATSDVSSAEETLDVWCPNEAPSESCLGAYEQCRARALAIYAGAGCDSSAAPLQCGVSDVETLRSNCGLCAQPEQSVCASNAKCGDTGCLVAAPAPSVYQGDSVGGPQIRTYDGLKYDFQAVGEFVLTRDARDGLEVQVRSAVWSERNVSVNTAVAMRNGDDRLGFYSDGRVRLNGAAHEFVEGYNPLPSGGDVWRNGSAIVVVWPDNSQVRLQLGSHVSVRVFVPASRSPRESGRLDGLLGDFDGNSGGELRTATGEVLGNPTAFTTFYGVFAESWRVTPQTSLFDYLTGETTDGFTDRNFPAALTTIDEVSEVALNDAKLACGEQAVAEPWLAACWLDVGLTGDESFAASLALAGTVVEEFVVEPPLDTCDVPTDRVCAEGAAYWILGCDDEPSLIEVCPDGAPCESGFCLEQTQAALRGLVNRADTNEPLSGVRITIKRDGVAVAAAVTGQGGLYALELTPGAYQLVFSVPGYLETTMTVELVAGEVTTVTGLRQVPSDDVSPGGVQGTIKNAINGVGVPSLQLELRAGINNLDGEILASTTTDPSGSYVLENLPPGNYTVTAWGYDYTSATFDVVVLAGVVTPNQDASIAPLLPAGNVQIVLTWQAEPNDLDSHLFTPSIDGGTYHISYQLRGDEASPPFAALDVDDTSGFGPETVTIRQVFPGVYVYRVYNYTGSPSLAGSGARVDVYDDTGLAKSYVVPTSGEGLWWDVFSLDGETGEITTVNALSVE